MSDDVTLCKHVTTEEEMHYTPESVAALTDHFADAFVRKNFARVYDVVTFENLTLTIWDNISYYRF